MKPDLSVQRVLLATDLSPTCESAFRYAADVATHFKARLYLLHVLPPSAGQLTDAQLVLEAQSAAEHRAESEMRRLRERLLTYHDDYMMAVVSGQPARRIVEKAREMAADLIILGIHDPGRQPGCPAVDVARQVCESSPCPVTCVPCGNQDPGPAVGILSAGPVAVGALRATKPEGGQGGLLGTDLLSGYRSKTGTASAQRTDLLRKSSSQR